MIRFWSSGTEADADLDAEVAARDHDRVGLGEDLVEHVDRLGLLDLGDHLRVRARLLDQLAQLADVGGRAHERERDVVDPELQRELEVADVLRRQRRDRQRDAGKVHALVRADHAADDDGAARAAILDLLDAQADEPVVDQHVVPRRQHLADHRRRDRQVAVAARPPRRRSTTSSPRASRRGRIEVADAELRPLEVGDERERAPRVVGRSRGSASAQARCWSCVACEKFRRAASIPASTSAASRSRSPLAGPIVARIFVRRGSGAIEARVAMRVTPRLGFERRAIRRSKKDDDHQGGLKMKRMTTARAGPTCRFRRRRRQRTRGGAAEPNRPVDRREGRWSARQLTADQGEWSGSPTTLHVPVAAVRQRRLVVRRHLRRDDHQVQADRRGRRQHRSRPGHGEERRRLRDRQLEGDRRRSRATRLRGPPRSRRSRARPRSARR